MSKTEDPKAFVNAFNGGHPGVSISINQAGLPEAIARTMRENRKINSGDTTHQLIIGKTRDGMSSFARSMSCTRAVSSATGLLSRLLRRV